MHNLAIALQKAGHELTGSDDEIYEPARGRLALAGLLPKQDGWHENRITTDIELVILGMHARADNPELLRAQALGLKIVSYPEFLRQHSADKIRVAIAGSHGKTTTTAMVMQILQQNAIDFDYAVGASVAGFETMVRLSDAPIIVIEADEYLSSPIDNRSKFLHYAPHIAVLTGVAHDHFNVFPTLGSYVRAFQDFAATITAGGQFFYYQNSAHLSEILPALPPSVQAQAYDTALHKIIDNSTYLQISLAAPAIPLLVFGAHNLQNMQAAIMVCRQLGLSDAQIYPPLSSFAGAARRLQIQQQRPNLIVFNDFGHAPSKVAATVAAVRAQYADCQLVAALELHTFSSLNADFLPNYSHSLAAADVAIAYFSPHTLAQKRLPNLEKSQLCRYFERPDLQVFQQAQALKNAIQNAIRPNIPTVVLLMSSGQWDSVDMQF
jgi:UDP-N-acetylmuramate: L-alanyl-gamma-D-glutamyl-meso-diaminopimelate ligase